MNDVLGKVVLTAGDEDLGTRNPVAAVAGRFRPGAHHAQIGASVGLGEIHGAAPAAAVKLRQV